MSDRGLRGRALNKITAPAGRTGVWDGAAGETLASTTSPEKGAIRARPAKSPACRTRATSEPALTVFRVSTCANES
jgi:hypothetical protein